MENLSYEKMCDMARRFIFDLEITDEKEEYEKDNQKYLVDNVNAVRDAYIADLESGHDFEGEDLPEFFTRHGIRWE